LEFNAKCDFEDKEIIAKLLNGANQENKPDPKGK